jgi:hypothetical protein
MMPLRYAYAFLAVAFLAMAAYSFGFPIIAGCFGVIGAVAAINRFFGAADKAGMK